MVLFVKTKFARDKHGQTVAGLVGLQVKAQQRLDCVPFRSLRFLFPWFGGRLFFDDRVQLSPCSPIFALLAFDVN